MSIANGLAAELDHEVATTKTYFERLPEDHFDYKPHEKSMPLGHLAGHLVEMFLWVRPTIELSVFNFDPATYVPFIPTTRAELIAELEKNVADAMEVLSGASDAVMQENWRMTMDGQPLFEMPRMTVIRTMMINHIIHHRAQLGVYMRMLDVPLPKTYGPTADEH